ncbi:MAG: transporter substrate-binding domain-containing protein [Natronospirillum sp.]|uniref:substrate-binding periplasmic protein n=1 Tax=Natronospirillum sp. TaxID=2812955 RepID=UPI0025E24401|nr:transporter substrate-binding domain-containing protein [Natronospirillum sp.]MCH8551242.1 transporter substrate-binding domain-containing protein [Natronospirillum sp.]
MLPLKLVAIGLFLAGLTHAEEPDVRLYTEHYPPFSMETEAGISGINTELLLKAFEQLGLEVQVFVEPWARAQAWSLQFDNGCLFSAARTTEREPMYLWAGPLSVERISLFSLAEDDILLASLMDAEQYRIGGQQRDYYTQWMVDQGLEVDAMSGDGSNVERLVRGRIDLWIAGHIGGPFMAASEGAEVRPAYIADEGLELWLACNPALSSDLVQRLDAAIADLVSDGTLNAIKDRYQ